MPFVPSHKDGEKIESSDAIEVAREQLNEALKPFFRGKNANARHAEAVAKALSSIQYLITVNPAPTKGPMGATVMTEGASLNKRPGSIPRTV